MPSEPETPNYSHLTLEELRAKVAEAEQAASGLLALSYGFLREEDTRELQDLREELQRGEQIKSGQ